MGLVIVLGPVPCHSCRVLVYWNGWEWQSAKGYRHACAKRQAA